MAQNKKLLDRLFSRFMRGKADMEDQSIWWKWFSGLDVQEQTTIDEATRERIWGNVLQKTLAPEKRSWRQPLVAAAILTGIIVAGLIWWPHKETGEQYVFHNNDGRSVQRLILPDSTEVMLNMHSSLRYSASYNTSDRRVTLRGEGYFKVHKDDRRPFIVQTEGLETRALGTAFNIEARDNETQVRIALTEGKVAVTPVDSPAQEKLLLPGQMLRYDRATRELTTTMFSADVAIWTSGGLSFNGIPLKEALDRLSTKYQLQVRYDEKQLTGKTVTACFGRNTWQHVLSGILFPHDLTYHVKDNIIIIR